MIVHVQLVYMENDMRTKLVLGEQRQPKYISKNKSGDQSCLLLNISGSSRDITELATS